MGLPVQYVAQGLPAELNVAFRHGSVVFPAYLNEIWWTPLFTRTTLPLPYSSFSPGWCLHHKHLATKFSLFVHAPAPVCSSQEKISSFDADDFVFKLGGPEPEAVVDGVELRSASVKQFPALEGQGLSVTIVNLGPCAINHPYVRPRATEVSIGVGIDVAPSSEEVLGVRSCRQ